MKRSSITIGDVVEWKNLMAATWLAASGKRCRPEIRTFIDHAQRELKTLHDEVVDQTIRLGDVRRFTIRDPKTRTITAPCLRERVLHHALMRLVGPMLERSLIDDTFACIKGRGTSAAILRCQAHARRFPWYVKMDICKYFKSIDHGLLMKALERKLKDQRLLGLIQNILDSYSEIPGVGLPIGTLTSQCFANFYLNDLDRFLLEKCKVKGVVRYMDDFVFWVGDKKEAQSIGAAAADFLSARLRLTCRGYDVACPCRVGVPLCGYRIYAGTIKLLPRRRQRIKKAQKRWDQLWLQGRIGSLELQRAYDSIKGMSSGTQADLWMGRLFSMSKTKAWYDEV